MLLLCTFILTCSRRPTWPFKVQRMHHFSMKFGNESQTGSNTTNMGWLLAFMILLTWFQGSFFCNLFLWMTSFLPPQKSPENNCIDCISKNAHCIKEADQKLPEHQIQRLLKLNSLYSVIGDFVLILRLLKDMVFKIKNKENTNIYIQCDFINWYAWVALTNLAQNTCHHNKKLDQILKSFAFILRHSKVSD